LVPAVTEPADAVAFLERFCDLTSYFFDDARIVAA